ncbi:MULTISPECIES: FHA domain-containing protein [unclassified Tolypothrix]|uniref:FHA domain-containing protein n=1 Tax=unclassified Tolypothrix TaxID=2649714 RepID=UPI0005EAA283|nr:MULTISPECIES: FHA domain-containing protein [unclassified Tolypothrix]BAY88162.1 Forkhead-associated protein [Microchaete diplosiphon NIES-3275]EKF02014.1 FHA domain containing protein [Tolypothrix sp. PCC 7601]MBE9087384.1 FHA domain-containing protein [Tolypothrix sp. LEGE 11397]UYD28866.1 FHA domain-containing protein [Tolypothrix sp. PCC 7712]UYD35223.1 FHA domain-containing protein [Tolypothrix sp. PCC 7601]
MQIQLSWIDPNSEERREPLLETPVAIGRTFAEMPQQIDQQRVSRITIQDDLIADYHALIDWQNQELTITDQNTSNGIKINGVQVTSGILTSGDRITIGACEIVVTFTATAWECDRMVGFLFKRRCGRTDRTGCPDCEQSYEDDYAYYSEYGNYRSGWGRDYYDDRDRYSYDPETGDVDFTEADAVSVETETDTEFETDMGAS